MENKLLNADVSKWQDKKARPTNYPRDFVKVNIIQEPIS